MGRYLRAGPSRRCFRAGLRGAGAIAGLHGDIAVGFFVALLGGTPSQVSGPTGPMSVVMAAVVAQYAGNRRLPGQARQTSDGLGVLAKLPAGSVFPVRLGALERAAAVLPAAPAH